MSASPAGVERGWVDVRCLSLALLPPTAPAMPGGAGAEASRGDRWIDSRETWALVPFCHQLALRLSVKKRRDVPWSSPRFILPVYFLCVGQSRQEEIISSGSMGSVNFCITSSLSHLPKRLDDFPFRGRIGHFFFLSQIAGLTRRTAWNYHQSQEGTIVPLV